MANTLDITKRLHDRILEIATTALSMIGARRQDSDLRGLAHLRLEMTQVVEAYSAHVLVKSQYMTDAASAQYLAALQSNIQALSRSYDKFRGRWVHRDAADNWHEYRLSCIVMVKEFRSLIEVAEQARVKFRNENPEHLRRCDRAWG